MKSILIATRNQHKVQEIRAILGAQFNLLTLNEFSGAPTVTEDAPDFAGNASKKAVTLAQWLTKHFEKPGVDFVLADDSGLEVDALKGAPGVHSARFAALDSKIEGNSSDQDNNARLLRLLSGVPKEKRTARFRCVIAFTPVFQRQVETTSPVCYADEAELTTQLFEGNCEGHILDQPHGSNGFGYDPLFVPDGFLQSFAELGDEVKNSISHRSKALQKLKVHLK
jgi:XTP/dITP diphosphohydrolase